MGIGKDYIAYLCKDENAHYKVRFPDCPGCVADGRTLEEAWENGTEALTRHLARLAEAGTAVPRASTLDELAGDPGMAHAVAVLVSVEPPEKTVRVNITARASQLEAIDRLARIAGMTRSAYLIQSAIREGKVTGRRRVALD